MKNKKTEKCIAKVLELGNSNDSFSVPRLIKALEYPNKQVRRLAVSALGKLANFAENPNDVVSALRPILRDIHLQTKQYAIKALSAYGAKRS